MKYQCDLLIIGCGIIGLTTGVLATIRNPKLKIILIDKNLIGFGASAYSAALSVPLSKSKSSYGKKLVTDSIVVSEELKNYIDLQQRVIPTYYIVENEINFRKHYLAKDLIRVEHKSIKPCSLVNISINANQKIYFSEKSAHFVNPVNLMQKMALFLRKRGNLILECTTLNAISIIAAKTVYTTGPWEENDNKKVAAVHLNSIPKKNDPAIIFYEENAFLLPLYEKGYWLFSFTSEDWGTNPSSELIFSKKDLMIAEKILAKYSLSLHKLFAGGRVFCDNYAGNGEIDISYISNLNAKVIGASGSGYRFSYAIANKIYNEFISK